LGRLISSKFGIRFKIWSLISFLSAKLTVRGAMSNLTLISFGHIGPSSINALRIAKVLLGVLPCLADTFVLSFYLDSEIATKDIYMREALGCGFSYDWNLQSSNPKQQVRF